MSDEPISNFSVLLRHERVDGVQAMTHIVTTNEITGYIDPYAPPTYAFVASKRRRMGWLRGLWTDFKDGVRKVVYGVGSLPGVSCITLYVFDDGRHDLNEGGLGRIMYRPGYR